MALQEIIYQAAGESFTGFLADGSGGAPAPGILVLHEGAGLTEETRRRTAMLGALGYVAFAADLFGEEIAALERAREIAARLRGDVGLLRARVRAALDLLARQPGVDPARLAAIGFCFGGAAAIELARTGADLKAVVGFHAGILPGTVEENRAIRASILLCHGADDPVVSVAQIHAFSAELAGAGVDWQVHVYGGVGHSFTNPEIDRWALPGFFYDARAAGRAWAAMQALFEEILA